MLYAQKFAIGILLAVVAGCDHSCNTTSEMDQLIATIGENPDMLHSNYTPSVNRLIDLGKDAIPAMLDIMENGDAVTRRHAQTVLAGVTMRMYGFVPGEEGWPKEQEDRWYELWIRLGNISYNDSQQQRNKAVTLWRDWLLTPESDNPPPKNQITNEDSDEEQQ